MTGGGAVYNPHWKTIGNIKNWLRKQKEGTVLAAAHPYLQHVAGSEQLIQDWDGLLGEKGGSVLVSAGCLGVRAVGVRAVGAWAWQARWRLLRRCVPPAPAASRP